MRLTSVATRVTISLLAVCLLIAACATPLPEDRKTYAGTWSAPGMRLTITPGGMVQYERKTGNTSKNISAPLKEFTSDGFVVGLGPMRTLFRVSRAPYQDGRSWKVVVDSVELTRRDDPRASP